MNSHRRHQSALHAYVDGELETPEIRRLEAHLAGCGECRLMLRDLERLRGVLRRQLEGPGPEVPASLWPGVRARIEGGQPEGPITAWIRRIWDKGWERPTLSLASATMVVFLILTTAYLAWVAPDRTVSVGVSEPGVVVEAVEPEPGFRAMVLTTSGQGLKVIWVVAREGT